MMARPAVRSHLPAESALAHDRQYERRANGSAQPWKDVGDGVVRLLER